MTPHEPVVGRREELAEVDRFLDRVPSGLHGLLLAGPAGIGKSTLLRAALAGARTRGFRVLLCRPSEVETGLSFAALIDLFAEVADEALPDLPEPQRLAVEAALLRSAPGAPAAPLAISLGVLAMLRSAAASAPVLLAIDDAPWLDDASARVLEFALRRLEDAPVGLLATRRTAGSRNTVPRVVGAIPPERRATVSVAPIPVDDTAVLVGPVLGPALRRPVVLLIHELSGGNPLYALELARATARREDVGAAAQPIPASLDDVVRDRIDALPAMSAPVMLLASSLSHPTREAVAAVAGQRAADDAIEAAVAAGVIEIDADAIRFTHPLLAASIQGRATAEERRNAHRALARVVRDPEERARHLARSTDDPDEAVAAALDAGASAAASRGAAAAAAELAQAAVRLTPHDDETSRRRRRQSAAAFHVAAGDVPYAIGMLQGLARDTPEADRAPILVALGEILLQTSDRTAAGTAFREALALTGDDLALRVRIETGLAAVAHLTWVDWASGFEHMASAMRAAEELGDPEVLAQTIGHFATWWFQTGRGVPRDLMARADALPRPGAAVPMMDHPDHQFGGILEAAGELAEARRRLERLLTLARERHAWSSLPWILMRLVRIEAAAGNWPLAEAELLEARNVAEQSGQDAAVGYLALSEVLLLALRGQVDRGRVAAAEAMRLTEAMGLPHRRLYLVSAAALLELSVREYGAAYQQLESAMGLTWPGAAEPAFLRPIVPLAIEALVGLGRAAEATELLAHYERLAREHGRAVSMADSLRCRALVSAAGGDTDTALRAAQQARAEFERLGMPFESARATLIVAEVNRRAKQKTAAREAAAAALKAFTSLGAQQWAVRAREEVARSEPRRAAGAPLTETEQRVADLVAEGRTNREIAGSLFMSVHTVEAHLTRLYRSFGVRSRTELARRLLEGAKPRGGEEPAETGSRGAKT